MIYFSMYKMKGKNLNSHGTNKGMNNKYSSISREFTVGELEALERLGKLDTRGWGKKSDVKVRGKKRKNREGT